MILPFTAQVQLEHISGDHCSFTCIQETITMLQTIYSKTSFINWFQQLCKLNKNVVFVLSICRHTSYAVPLSIHWVGLGVVGVGVT